MIPSPYNRLGYQKIFKEECNNSITLRRKNFFFLAAGAKQNFFQNSGTFLRSDVVIYMERKIFFQNPKPNIIDREKIF